ncbi:hypothetical protein GGS23DRAFT_565683 [Durotheca rogersii]|uniref:uncharacterized protein n=1 Tax=Durotheca rogersii TaxID=419775 RepID=UPI002220A385|nr:uncharacterized protein GGS23DRAFT_565683 [Durotheca rogersii]KAI5863855.1 hypothetical protein GGS23DRAFT_565683 [Durotheca rogersii]
MCPVSLCVCLSLICGPIYASVRIRSNLQRLWLSRCEIREYATNPSPPTLQNTKNVDYVRPEYGVLAIHYRGSRFLYLMIHHLPSTYASATGSVGHGAPVSPCLVGIV